MGGLTRATAFLRKDLMEVLRQPRMVLMLIIGPFLILLAFGLGYDASRPPLGAIVVMSENSTFQGRTDQLAESLGGGVTLERVVNNQAEARRALLDGQIDLVIVLPDDPEAQVQAGEQADIRVYHTQIDPFERTFVELAVNSAVEELNRAILRESLVEVRDR